MAANDSTIYYNVMPLGESVAVYNFTNTNGGGMSSFYINMIDKDLTKGTVIFTPDMQIPSKNYTYKVDQKFYNFLFHNIQNALQFYKYSNSQTSKGGSKKSRKCTAKTLKGKRCKQTVKTGKLCKRHTK